MRRRWIVVLALAALVGLHSLGNLLSGPAPPGGPTSSSYASGGDGVGAYAELLRGADRPVVQVRQALDRRALDPRSDVVFVLDAPVRLSEVERLRTFVEAGGTLVASGPTVDRWVRSIVSPPRLVTGSTFESATSTALAPAPETAGVASVVGSTASFAGDDSGLLPVLGHDGRVTAAVATVGEGRVVLLPDASPLWNGNLAEADNAAFGLALVPAGRRALFAEQAHGYGQGEGAGAIPDAWQLAIATLAAAVVLFGWSRARRLGPPTRPDRELPPPRAAYIEAMATTLAQTRDPERALAPLRDEGRRLLLTRVGAAAADDDGALRSAAAACGLERAEVDALLGEAGDRATMLAVGRAVARLADEDGGR